MRGIKRKLLTRQLLFLLLYSPDTIDSIPHISSHRRWQPAPLPQTLSSSFSTHRKSPICPLSSPKRQIAPTLEDSPHTPNEIPTHRQPPAPQMSSSLARSPRRRRPERVVPSTDSRSGHRATDFPDAAPTEKRRRSWRVRKREAWIVCAQQRKLGFPAWEGRRKKKKRKWWSEDGERRGSVVSTLES